MNKEKLSVLFKSLTKHISDHGPAILTGIGIAGGITTTILAVRATPKALTLIEAKKKELDSEKLSISDMVKATWKCYIPAVLTGGLAIVCVVSAQSVNVRRNAAIAAAYSLSETTLKDYQKKVLEAVGEKKEQEIKDAASQEKINRNPVTGSEIYITGKGDTLCFDVVSGRYFKSDIELLRRVENNLNREMRDEMSISLNEFYSEIGLDAISIGDDLGWNIERGYISINPSAMIADNGQPCLVLNYDVPPSYDYII